MSRLQNLLIDAVIVLLVIGGAGMLMVTLERHARASVKEAQIEAGRSAEISPKEYQALMTHPVGGCEQFIQKCGNGKCRAYPVCADLTKRNK